MATEIKIPIADQTTEEVRIVKWIKQEGEAVKKGEVVLEVETDKSVIEIEAVGQGVLLKQLYGENDMVPVGKVVGYVGTAGEKMVEEQTGTAETVGADGAGETPHYHAGLKEIPPQEVQTSGRIKASPIARRRAGEMGVDLSRVKGTGPNGRIVREDVERAAAGLKVGTAERAGAHVVGAGETPHYHAGLKEAGEVQMQPRAGTEVTVTKMRRAIGLNLQMSARDVPHFHVTMSIDMSRALRLRAELNRTQANAERVSVNDLVLRAAAEALKRYPGVNSRFTGQKIIYLAEINIGVATAVADGLVVPVLVGADRRDWSDLATQTKRLAEQARTGKIIGAGKGTFTVTNLGMYGVDNFTAIINPPESAILAVGAIKEEAAAIEGDIGIRPMMKVTLCSDHRVVDGALAAEFLRYIKVYLEEEIR